MVLLETIEHQKLIWYKQYQAITYWSIQILHFFSPGTTTLFVQIHLFFFFSPRKLAQQIGSTSCSLQYFTMESGGNICRIFVIEPFGHGESYQKKKSCILIRYVKNVCGRAISMISLMSPISYHLITFLTTLLQT